MPQVALTINGTIGGLDCVSGPNIDGYRVHTELEEAGSWEIFCVKVATC